MPNSQTQPAPRRIYVMHRMAWWRLSLEEWWWFVAAKLRSGNAAFPNVNLLGQPRAVSRVEAEDGSVTYRSGDAAVWVEAIDGWDRGDWKRAAERLEALGMTAPASATVPWPPGAAPVQAPEPVYPIEAYQERAPELGDSARDRRRGDTPAPPGSSA